LIRVAHVPAVPVAAGVGTGNEGDESNKDGGELHVCFGVIYILNV